MSEHAWFHEQLPLYLTAGLDAVSVERLQRHAAECDECGQALKSMDSLDHALLDVFADTRPDAALESKLIARLREAEAAPSTPSSIANRERAGAKSPPKNRRWLKMLGIAASVVLLLGLGGLGAVLSEWLDEEGQPAAAQNNLKQLSIALWDDSGSMDGETKEGKHTSITGGIIGGKGKGQRGTSVWIGPLDAAATEFDADLNYNVNRRADVSVPGSAGLEGLGDLTEKWGLQWGETRKPVEYWSIPMGGDAGKDEFKARFLGRSGISNGTKLSEELAQPKSEAGTPPMEQDEKTYFEFSQTYSRTTNGRTNLDGSTKHKESADDLTDGPLDRLSAADKRSESERSRQRGEPLGEMETLSRKASAKLDDNAIKVFDEFFAQAPGKKPEENAPATGGGGTKNLGTQAGTRIQPSNGPKDQSAVLALSQDDKQKGSTEIKPPVGNETRRVVIRSGDIEFEVDSFDDAAAVVARLTNATKGGFVATTNSRKRENGKMEGTVVVRVPPTELDGLVESLRKALSKAGELKGQNIGSQDVTKQYVDTESTLRAARTTEERLLRVIKEGKGEIKDLVIAEEKLGKVRGEIERMEGELRYYANLAALSTLSVKLTEKDLQVAAKLIETATVKASIEVEDVEKARQEVQKAIADLRGRVIKSESKQQSTGEFNVALEFETPADATEAMRDRLRKLGTAAMLDTEIAQRTEGAGTTPKDGKTEKGPTTFKLALVNFGQLPARDVLHAVIAVRDVRDTERKLRSAVVAAKGNIREWKVKEIDRQNVTADIEFDVPTAESKQINELLAGLGERLNASMDRRRENERATEQRVAYTIKLSPSSRLEPRELHVFGIEVANVDSSLESLEGQVKGAGGRMYFPQLKKEPSGQVISVVTFDVPLAETGKMQKRIRSVGTVRVHRAKQNESAPDGPLAIARFELTLSNQELLVPRDQGAGVQIRQGTQVALRGLSLSIGWVIGGVLFVGPWVLLIYGIIRLVRRMRRPATPTA
jgi:hypothetical protein